MDITGHTSGKLMVLAEARKDNHSHVFWFCKCACGSIVTVSSSNIMSGHSTSCGCLRNALNKSRRLVHGHRVLSGRTKEYRAYLGAINRCRNPNNKAYKFYGGRGIKFLFKSFREFLKDIGICPNKALSVDRKNNNRHYEPGNVRWATAAQQANNRRKRRS